MRVLHSLLVIACIIASLFQVQALDTRSVFDSIVHHVRDRLGHKEGAAPISINLPDIETLPKEITHPAEKLLPFQPYEPMIPTEPAILPDQRIEIIGSGKAHHCKECIRWTAHHILAATVNSTLEFCAKTKCPKIKAKCAWIVKNLNFSVGYIAQRIRPVQSGRLFCEGAGRCPVHNKTEMSIINGDGADVMDNLMGDEETIDSLVHEAETSSINNTSSDSDEDIYSLDDTVLENIDEFFVKLTEGDDENNHFIKHLYADQLEGKPSILCIGCIQLVSAHIVGGLWSRTAAFCKNATTPVWKQRCEWTFSHADFSTGYLYAKFTPQKFGYGFCYAKKLCPHPCPSSKMMQPSPMFDVSF